MDNKTKILEAAISVFAESGKEGARVETIAARSGLNKAMIYYYFTNKDKLFEEAISRIIIGVYQELEAVSSHQVTDDDDPVELMSSLVRNLFYTFAKRDDYSSLINSTLAKHSDTILRVLARECLNEESTLVNLASDILNLGVKKGIFRSVDHSHLEINIIGMTLIFYIAKPIAQVFLHEEMDDAEFLEKRIESTLDLLLHGIMVK